MLSDRLGALIVHDIEGWMIVACMVAGKDVSECGNEGGIIALRFLMYVTKI